MRTLSAILAVAVYFGGATFDAFAQTSEAMPPRKPSPLTVRQIHSGHSLSDTYGAAPWPGRLILATAARAGEQSAHRTIFRSIIPGASLGWRWKHTTGRPDAREHISEAELLVTTERVPLAPDAATLKVDTLDWLDKWVAHAGQKGNGGKGAEVLIYSTWIPWRSSGNSDQHIPFRKNLEIQGASWELMQDTANANRPSGMPLIYMIPGHRLMMRIYDDIKSGVAPGLSSIGDLFTDDIHLNDLGQYAITCLVYGVIYQRDPREIPARLVIPRNAQSREHDTLSREQADYFKAIAWSVATSYPRSGVPPK